MPTEENVVLTKPLPPMRVRWLKALRAYSFPASVVPVAVGVAAPFWAKAHITWWTVPLVLAVGVLIHIGTNLINDVVDYEKGVDREGALGGSGVLLDGWLTPGQIRNAAIGAFVFAGIIGIPVLMIRGWPLVVIGAIGVLGGYFYTAPPLSLKYRALGDFIVYLCCGPLLVAGVSLAVCGIVPMAAIVAGLVVGLPVTALLVANNLRDMDDDRELKIRTLAMVFGPRWTKVEYLVLMIGALVSAPVLAVFGVLPYTACLSIGALFVALRPIRDLVQGRVEEQVVERTAQFHLVFGMLLTLGLFL